MLKLGCLVILAVLIAVPAVAARFLPWWGVVLVVVGEAALVVGAGPKLMVFAVKRFAMGLFLKKSRVLRNARVEVHRVERTDKPVTQAAATLGDEGEETGESVGPAGPDGPQPPEEPEEPEEPDDRHYVLIDFTLTPAASSGPMRYYDTTELMLIPFDAKVDMSEDPASDDKSASVAEQWLVDPSGGETRDFDKLTGPARLRTVFACPPTLHGRVKFQYYFETFGDLVVP